MKKTQYIKTYRMQKSNSKGEIIAVNAYIIKIINNKNTFNFTPQEIRKRAINKVIRKEKITKIRVEGNEI